MAYNSRPRSNSSGSPNNRASARSSRPSHSSASRSSLSASQPSTRATRQTPLSHDATRSTAKALRPKGRPSQGGSIRRSASSSIKRTSAQGYRSVASSATAHAQSRSYTQRNTQEGRAAGQGRAQFGSSTPLRSTSVSQVTQQRSRAVRATKRARGGRYRIAIGICAVVLVVLGIAGFVLYQSNTFAVEKVSVSGVEHLTSEEMTELAQIPRDTTLLRLDAGGIESRLTSNPWVLEAQVERIFPDTVNLNITERSIAAIVEVKVDDSATSETWALSSDGMWLMKIPDQNSEEGKSVAQKIYDDASSALRITDVPYGSVPEAGTICNNANIENALTIIAGMSTELSDRVKNVAASDAQSTTLTLDNGVEVAFGDAENIRDKERVILQLMEEYPNKIAYINVRTVSNPIWRTV